MSSFNLLEVFKFMFRRRTKVIYFCLAIPIGVAVSAYFYPLSEPCEMKAGPWAIILGIVMGGYALGELFYWLPADQKAWEKLVNEPPKPGYQKVIRKDWRF